MSKTANVNFKQGKDQSTKSSHAKKSSHGTFRAKRKPNSPRVKSQGK